MSHLLTGLLIVRQTGILPLTGPQESAEQKRQQPLSLRAQRARLRLHLLYPLATRGSRDFPRRAQHRTLSYPNRQTASHIADPRPLFVDANQLRVRLFLFHFLGKQIGVSNQRLIDATKPCPAGRFASRTSWSETGSASQTKPRPRIAQQCKRSRDQRRRRNHSFPFS